MIRRVLILAHAHDGGAAAVAETVARRLGSGVVGIVRPEALGVARWSHRVDGSGRASARLTLARGATYDTESIGCVFNRLRYLPVPRFSRASPKDRDYAAVELHALVASWLGGLGARVVNPMASSGLAGAFVSGRGWVGAAAACGLPVTRRVAATAGRLLGPLGPGECARRDESWPGGLGGPMPVTVGMDEAAAASAGSVLVAGEEVGGTLAETYGASCLALARRAGCSLVEFRFSSLQGRPVLTAVDPLPPLDHRCAVAAAGRLVEAVAGDETAHR